MSTSLTKKKFSFPSSKLLLFILIVVVTIATHVVPAGQYQYTVNEAGTTVVDASSYTHVDQDPVSLFRMFVAVAQGFVDGGQVSFLILFGYFWIYSIMQTGALNALISKLISKKEKSELMNYLIVHYDFRYNTIQQKLSGKSEFNPRDLLVVSTVIKEQLWKS